MLKKRLREAKFGQENTFEGFDFNFNESAIPSRLIREIASCHETVCRHRRASRHR